MGTDKAMLPWGKTTLLGHVVTSLRPMHSEVLVVVDRPERYAVPGAREVVDIRPGNHAIGGLHAGLVKASHDSIFVTACDHPFICPGLIRHLFRTVVGVDAAVPEVNGRLQPLCAVYARSALDGIAARLDARKMSIKDALATLQTTVVPESTCREFDRALRCFDNVNSRRDYAEALAASCNPPVW